MPNHCLISLLSRSLTDDLKTEFLPDMIRHGQCAVTGTIGACLPRDEVISVNTFNNQNLFDNDSDLIGIDAAQVMKCKPLRTRSWIVSGDPPKLRFVGRDDWRNIIVSEQYPAIPWGAYVTFTGKKHGSLRTKMNIDASRLVTVEELHADLTNAAAMYARIADAYDRGISRAQILGLQPTAVMLKKAGMGWWSSWSAWAEHHHRSGAYRLCVWCLPSNDKGEVQDADNNDVK